MNRNRKRRASLVLALLLIFSVLPLGAMAEAEIKITPPTAPVVFVGTRLGDVPLEGGSVTADLGEGPVPVSGEFSWKAPNTILSGYGVFYHEAIFTPTGESKGLIEPQTVKVKVRVYRYTPIITVLPAAAELPAGSELSASGLTGGTAISYYERSAAVPGHFEWVDGDEAMEIPGTFSRGVRFIPDDQQRYDIGDSLLERVPGGAFAESRVDVVVTGDKIVRVKNNSITGKPIGSEQAASIREQKGYRRPLTVKELPELRGEISVGERLDCIKLEGGEAVNYKVPGQFVRGRFLWADGSETFDQPGEYTREIIFIPDESAEYNPGTLTFKRDSRGSFINAALTFTVR